MRPPYRFTAGEEQFLRANHQKMTVQMMSDVLGRKQGTVSNKLSNMGLDPNEHNDTKYLRWVIDKISREVLLQNGCGDLINVN